MRAGNDEANLIMKLQKNNSQSSVVKNGGNDDE